MLKRCFGVLFVNLFSSGWPFGGFGDGFLAVFFKIVFSVF